MCFRVNVILRLNQGCGARERAGSAARTGRLWLRLLLIKDDNPNFLQMNCHENTSYTKQDAKVQFSFQFAIRWNEMYCMWSKQLAYTTFLGRSRSRQNQTAPQPWYGIYVQTWIRFDKNGIKSPWQWSPIPVPVSIIIFKFQYSPFRYSTNTRLNAIFEKPGLRTWADLVLMYLPRLRNLVDFFKAYPAMRASADFV